MLKSFSNVFLAISVLSLSHLCGIGAFQNTLMYLDGLSFSEVCDAFPIVSMQAAALGFLSAASFAGHRATRS